MFIVNWFKSALGYLGIYQKNAKILFLGLDNAGKSTLLQMLREDRIGQLVPTQHPQSDELAMGNVRFRTFDLGGHDTARKIWNEYFASVDAIIYMVDATDHDRFHISRNELENLLSYEELQNTPFVILGNKIDIRNAVGEEELRAVLGLENYPRFPTGSRVPEGTRPIELFMCSVTKKIGYGEAFEWLIQFLR